MSWCAGLSSGTCDLVNEMQLGQDSTFVSRFLTKPIMNGQRYYVTVKATNGAGVTTSVTSDGVTVDDTPPIAGIVIDVAVIDINHVNGESDISASWSDFQDVESGIDSYEVAFCDSWNLSSCPQTFTKVGNATNVTIAGEIQLCLIESEIVSVTGYPSSIFNNIYLSDFARTCQLATLIPGRGLCLGQARQVVPTLNYLLVVCWGPAVKSRGRRGCFVLTLHLAGLCIFSVKWP